MFLFLFTFDLKTFTLNVIVQSIFTLQQKVLVPKYLENKD